VATEQLKKIIKDVQDRRIVLPQFQRDFVWQVSSVTKLLVSLFSGYPIGSLLLMENNENYEFRAIDGVPDGAPVPASETLLVLDGQQRLTAAYRAFIGTLDNGARYPGRYYFNYAKFVEIARSEREIDGSEELEDLFQFVRPSKINKELRNTADEISRGFFPLDVIFGAPRGSSYADWLSRFNFQIAGGSSDEYAALARIAAKFQTDFIERVTSYQVNFEKITRDTKPDVICTVFETINTTGVKLTVFDLLVAKCFKRQIRLRDKLEEAVSRFENIRFFESGSASIAVVHLPKIIGLMHNNQCKKGDLLQMPVEAIAQNWDGAVIALDRFLGMLRTEFGCVRTDLIPSIDVISPLAMILSDVRFSRDLHFRKFERLYWNLVFSLYLSGAPETKSSRIVREWRNDGGYRDSDESLPEAIRTFSFSPDDMDEATKASAVYRGILTLLIARGARDFGHQRAVLRIARDLPIEDHHIFPQQFLRNHGIKGYIANGILNRTPILEKTNRQISSDAPVQYFSDHNVVGESGIPEDILRGHAIDKDLVMATFDASLFERFRADRRAKIVAMIADVVGQTIVNPEPS
jgi:hypothetical protein